MKPSNLPKHFVLSHEVARALDMGLPVMAFESAVITHGLPYPDNLNLAQAVEAQARGLGVTPATIAVLDGKITVGLAPAQLERLAGGRDSAGRALLKISSRDFAAAVAQGRSGGTTVAGTLLAAAACGIRVFATGGIGGVHRRADPAAPLDVSADLTQLSRSPLVVVCAGAKAILDLPATLETLETLGVPVIGYQTDEFPAFYSTGSGLKLTARADTPELVAEIARAHWSLGPASASPGAAWSAGAAWSGGAVLVAVPPPAEVALPREQVEALIQQALAEASEKQLRGQAVTPFLLERLARLSHGDSLRANLGLLKNNARLGAEIARRLAPPAPAA